MQLISPAEAAARVRAALAYSGMEYEQLSEKTKIPVGTLRGITSRTRPTSGTLERLWAIADACGVPRWFVEHGFEPPAEMDSDVGGRLEFLEAAVAETQEVLAEAAAARAATAAENQQMKDTLLRLRVEVQQVSAIVSEFAVGTAIDAAEDLPGGEGQRGRSASSRERGDDDRPDSDAEGRGR